MHQHCMQIAHIIIRRSPELVLSIPCLNFEHDGNRREYVVISQKQPNVQ